MLEQTKSVLDDFSVIHWKNLKKLANFVKLQSISNLDIRCQRCLIFSIIIDFPFSLGPKQLLHNWQRSCCHIESS